MDATDKTLGQMLMVGFAGPAGTDSILADVAERNLGGVILFDGSGNIEKPQQLQSLTAELQSRAETALLVTVDQEGGEVARLRAEHGFAETASPAELGGQGPHAAGRAGTIIGETLAGVGINLALAPVVDVNVNPDSPAIGARGRSFSANPAVVTACGEAFIAGLHSCGTASCLKHFPGHGSARADTHLELTDITETWSEAELQPFEQIIAGGNCDTIMVGHLFNRKLDADYPASLSAKVVTDLLRERLGFDGVVISDDLQMKAITDHYTLAETIELSVNAGVDILVFSNNLESDDEIVPKVLSIIANLIEAGKTTRWRIERSLRRIAALKSTFR